MPACSFSEFWWSKSNRFWCRQPEHNGIYGMLTEFWQNMKPIQGVHPCRGHEINRGTSDYINKYISFNIVSVHHLFDKLLITSL